jgi:hypothetical protein
VFLSVVRWPFKNHVFTTICPQKTIEKPRSARPNLQNPFEKQGFTARKKIPLQAVN